MQIKANSFAAENGEKEVSAEVSLRKLCDFFYQCQKQDSKKI